MSVRLRLLSGVLVVLAFSWNAPAQSGAQPSTAEKQKIPVMDGGAGPCSIDLAVLDSDGKPVFAATVKVHIAYGFGGFHRLDLQAGTNEDGKVRFTGLPDRVRRPPLKKWSGRYRHG
jgi:hypothetical protein